MKKPQKAVTNKIDAKTIGLTVAIKDTKLHFLSHL